MLPLCDGVYTLRRKRLQKGDLQFINYEQIYADFALNEDENELMNKTLVVASTTQELSFLE